MLAISAGLYVAVNLLRLNLPHYPTTDTWFLNPLAWQFLFAIGLTLGWRAKRGVPVVPLRPWWGALAGGFLLVCLAAVLADAYHPQATGVLGFLIVPDKSYLSVPRLLHFLALAYVVAALTVGARWMGSMLARPFLVMGQQALAVFCVGSVLAIMAQVVRFEAGGGVFVDSLLIGCGILAQVLVAEYLAWRKTTARRMLPGAVAVR